jgi:hypothetical protein
MVRAMLARDKSTTNRPTDSSDIGATRVALLAIAGGLGGTSVLVAVSTAFTDHDALRWMAIFGIALSVMMAGLVLWTPDLTRREDREKVGLALMAAALFFTTGAFMALQTERVERASDRERLATERGFDLAAEKRRLIVELGVRRNLTAIDLRHRDVSGAALRGRTLTRALLDGANMNNTDLTRASLRGAVLVRTRLSGARLRNADLRGSDLSFAVLRGADLRGADLRGTKGIASAALRGARADADTRWPTMGSIEPDDRGVVCLGGDCGTPQST